MKQMSNAAGMKLFLGFLIVGLSGAAVSAIAASPFLSLPTLTVEQAASPGLTVQIDNVTDDQSSRGSSVELFVDGKKISPSVARKQGRRDYVFEMALAPGIYKVKAVYRAKSFWKEKSFDLMTHDGHVRIYPEHRTFLIIALDKNSDGTLRDKKNYFTEMTRPLAPAIVRESKYNPSAGDAVSSLPTSLTPAIAQPSPAVERVPATAAAPVVTIAPAASVPAMPRENSPAVVSQPAAPSTEAAYPIPPRAGKIALQINTSPSSAEIIVDDRYLGQSPLTTYIDRSRSHVIQISKAGYSEIMKIIDARVLGDENTYLMIEKLEAQK